MSHPEGEAGCGIETVESFGVDLAGLCGSLLDAAEIEMHWKKIVVYGFLDGKCRYRRIPTKAHKAQSAKGAKPNAEQRPNRASAAACCGETAEIRLRLIRAAAG